MEGDTCTVVLEGDSREVSTSISGCRLRHEAGHITLVDTSGAALASFFKGCCRMIRRRAPVVEDAPRHVSGADVA